MAYQFIVTFFNSTLVHRVNCANVEQAAGICRGLFPNLEILSINLDSSF